jgi:hypothetical protein
MLGHILNYFCLLSLRKEREAYEITMPSVLYVSHCKQGLFPQNALAH